MDDAKKALEALLKSQEEHDAEEGRKLMAQWMKKKLDAMAMHPHQRNSAVSLTLNSLKNKVLN